MMQLEQTNRLADRGLRPASELARNRQHGDRLRYIAGCRCDACRRANSAYECMRARARKEGDWNGIVPAAKARAHLDTLSALGVGRRSVGAVSGVADTILADIIAGRKTNIRARTEKAILAVTTEAAADHSLVQANETWRLLDELISDGYTKAELARLLGYKTRSLQLNRHQVTVRNAYDVKRLYQKLRMVSAKQAVYRLNLLSEEGYTRRAIIEGLEKLARDLGKDAPDLTIRLGRIRADAAALIEQLYRKLVQE